MPTKVESSNRRLAKNTLLLYIRMFIMMIVGLYTSRLVLEVLGVRDYGIYNVVGGVVTTFTFLNGTLGGATQRFINVEMGRGTVEDVKIVFKTALQLHMFVGAIILFFAETIGLWFLNTHMNIEPTRMFAANCVYQCSVATCIISVITVPYNGLVIAHEKMGAFAYISLIEVALKLIGLWGLLLITIDHLILYAILMMIISIINRLIYNIYCRRNFQESSVRLKGINKSLVKSIASFSGWSLVGSIGYMSHFEGIAILINIFFGTLVNAAQGITNTVNGVVQGFAGNFMVALSPQLVKTYAAEKFDELYKLIVYGSKLSIYLITFIALPIMFMTETLLNWWLPEVPEYTVIFIRLTLIITIVNSFKAILINTQNATGKIKWYQITLTIVGLFHLPLAWIFFVLGYAPYSAMVIYVFITIILQILRIWFVHHSTGLPVTLYIREVIVTSLSVIFLSASITLVISALFHTSQITNAIICLLLFFSSLWGIGLNKTERALIIHHLKSKFIHI